MPRSSISFPLLWKSLIVRRVYYLAVLKGRDRGFMRKQRCPAAPDFQPTPYLPTPKRGSIIRFMPELGTTASARGQTNGCIRVTARFRAEQTDAVDVFTALSAAIALAQKPPMVDVGVVRPQDVITGETVSGATTVNLHGHATIFPSRRLSAMSPSTNSRSMCSIISSRIRRILRHRYIAFADHRTCKTKQPRIARKVEPSNDGFSLRNSRLRCCYF